MSYQEARKFITYLTNINLRALLMSDGIINDLRGSVEQHSQNHSPHQSFHISPTHTVLLDPQRISQAVRRRYGAEGNKGKHSTSDLDLFRLIFCLSLRCNGSWSCSLFYYCGTFFFFPIQRIEFTNFRLHPPCCWAIFNPISSHDPLGVSSQQKMGLRFLCRKPGGCPGAGKPLLSCGRMSCSGCCWSRWGCSRKTFEFCFLCWLQQSWGNLHPPFTTHPSLLPVSGNYKNYPTGFLHSAEGMNCWPHFCSSANHFLRTSTEAKAWGYTLEEQPILLGVAS